MCQVRGEESEAVSRIKVQPREKRPVYQYECQAQTPGINITTSHTKSLSLHCEYMFLSDLTDFNWK